MTSRRTAALLASLTVTVGALALGASPVGSQSSECAEQPYSPVAFTNTYPAQDEPPTVPGEVVSERLELSNRTFDSDGDGADDTVTNGEGQVVVARGDGDVVLTGAGLVSAFAVGDIDGDGRDEFAVSADGTLHLVPGTTPAGTTTAAAAGVLMPAGAFGLFSMEDGSGRLLAYVGTSNALADSRTDIFDGATVLALGPGGDASALSPGNVMPGWVTTVADLGWEFPWLVSGRLAADREAVEVFLAVGETSPGAEPVRLTTAPETYFPNYVDPVGGLTVIDGPDGQDTYVRLGQSSPSGSAEYVWSIFDPCVPLVADTTAPVTTVPVTTPAPPAQPVAATATFTG